MAILHGVEGKAHVEINKNGIKGEFSEPIKHPGTTNRA